eukprot:CAMPEP_0119347404 /NCGR_PEP_ID=MMETSP1333-20130426/108507_1 /TAXON_ID=418940 /ORGANISM="Scyphosphaera apsteinii, Strain RCC1455" /LENGTH=142 /DNA_ID=CAMNT_0007359949 /DNA_START=791 /DNA_END=1219 /DNA_ORIENTATION=+
MYMDGESEVAKRLSPGQPSTFCGHAPPQCHTERMSLPRMWAGHASSLAKLRVLHRMSSSVSVRMCNPTSQRGTDHMRVSTGWTRRRHLFVSCNALGCNVCLKILTCSINTPSTGSSLLSSSELVSFATTASAHVGTEEQSAG